jgi:GAF domain-containing protein
MDQGPDPASITSDELALVAALRDALIQASLAPSFAASAADDLLDGLVRAATVAIPSPAGSLLLVDREANALTFAVVIGQTASRLAGVSLPLGRGIAGLVAASGQPLAISNAQQDPRHARDIAEQSGYLPNTILAVPVMADGEVIGVLELLDRQGAPTYGLADMELLGQFAALCAGALVQRRAETLQAAIIGRALQALGGLPDEAATALAARAQTFAERVTADPAAQRARRLASQVSAIAARGDAEQRACEGILAIFADYIAAHPEPGASLAALGRGDPFPRGPR